ncbi:MAG: L-histidine Nalpha-methyltransferase [Pseudonocardiales bacterium]|jgi:L-histidine N-alpha-methyltransferase|nr:L-histidine Nalpha-methyltransferase [Pseudonocardiales bacterium]MDT7695436.1 L-histidine Nalpha-methyltransferase [Pseudonocardiales bacterium]MDT7753756.1 L-histidine Nalpha-methyltransferase [Pseudonocardiales bacterium]
MTSAVLDVYLSESDAEAELRSDARFGLTAVPKVLQPKWFYDAAGSEIYERITALPEYYPFNAEREILRAQAGQIAAASGAEALVELGSGSSEKTRLLLDALSTHGTLRSYLPLDVSEAALREATSALAVDYPRLMVHGIVGDFTRHLSRIPAAGKRLLAFLGGTIGNLMPEDRAVFLRNARAVLRPGEQLLVGVGLVIDPAVMVPAYDDSQGVTADFNRNVLRVLNRELGADFDVDAFEHLALWNAEREWIEMRLRATRRMTVHVAELGLHVPFAEGEEMRTETSAKFRPAGLRAELTGTGFELTELWTDSRQRFALALATAH